MSPEELIKHHDQPFGYWGAAMFVIILVSGGWLGRYAINKIEQLLNDLNKAHQEQNEDLKTSHAQQNELLGGIVIDNTRAFNALTLEMQKHSTELHEMRGTVMKCKVQNAQPGN